MAQGFDSQWWLVCCASNVFTRSLPMPTYAAPPTTHFTDASHNAPLAFKIYTSQLFWQQILNTLDCTSHNHGATTYAACCQDERSECQSSLFVLFSKVSNIALFGRVQTGSSVLICSRKGAVRVSLTFCAISTTNTTSFPPKSERRCLA